MNNNWNETPFVYRQPTTDELRKQIEDGTAPPVPIYRECPLKNTGTPCYCPGTCRQVVGHRPATLQDLLPPTVRY